MTALAAGTPLLGGRFTIVRLLGQDDIATLYAVRAVADSREYLIELLTGPAALDEVAWRECVRVAELASTFPGAFAQLVESGTDAGFGRCLLREGMPGSSLGQSPGDRVATLLEVVALLEGLAASLDRAHAAGLVHGGISPSCVFPATATTPPKLAEFGVAAMRARRPSPWPVLLGWGAPEGARGEAMGPAADVYSLAVVAYRALTGRAPFASLTASPIDLQALWAEMTGPQTVATGLGPAVDGALAEAMHADPRQRTPSVSALAAALRGAVAASAVAVPGPTNAVPTGHASTPAPVPRRAFGGTMVLPGREKASELAAVPTGQGPTISAEAAADAVAASAQLVTPAGAPPVAPPEPAVPPPVISPPAMVRGEATPARRSALPFILAALAVFVFLALGGVALALGLYFRSMLWPASAPSPTTARSEATAEPVPEPPLATSETPSPAASTAPSTTIVRFECDPACDAIECDGKPVSLDASGVALTGGEHLCTLRREGYVPRTEAIHVVTGAPLLQRFRLERVAAPAGSPAPAPAGLAPRGTATVKVPPSGPAGTVRPGTAKPAATAKCGTFINPCKK